jgi:hypothetical protein
MLAFGGSQDEIQVKHWQPPGGLPVAHEPKIKLSPK